MYGDRFFVESINVVMEDDNIGYVVSEDIVLRIYEVNDEEELLDNVDRDFIFNTGDFN